MPTTIAVVMETFHFKITAAPAAKGVRITSDTQLSLAHTPSLLHPFPPSSHFFILDKWSSFLNVVDGNKILLLIALKMSKVLQLDFGYIEQTFRIVFKFENILLFIS